MRFHRIALAQYSLRAADAFSGKGGMCGKGRWHTVGRPIVYVAEHLSLAMAESLVHIQRSNSIAPFKRWDIEIPDHFIAKQGVLPKGWEKDYSITQPFGDAWLASNASVALLVPSAIVQEEQNCLLNPAHPLFTLKWVISGPHSFTFDSRLTRP